MRILLVLFGALMVGSMLIPIQEPDSCDCAAICARHKSCDIPKCNQGK